MDSDGKPSSSKPNEPVGKMAEYRLPQFHFARCSGLIRKEKKQTTQKKTTTKNKTTTTTNKNKQRQQHVVRKQRDWFSLTTTPMSVQFKMVSVVLEVRAQELCESRRGDIYILDFRSFLSVCLSVSLLVRFLKRFFSACLLACPSVCLCGLLVVVVVVGVVVLLLLLHHSLLSIYHGWLGVKNWLLISRSIYLSNSTPPYPPSPPSSVFLFFFFFFSFSFFFF